MINHKIVDIVQVKSFGQRVKAWPVYQNFLFPQLYSRIGKIKLKQKVRFWVTLAALLTINLKKKKWINNSFAFLIDLSTFWKKTQLIHDYLLLKEIYRFQV